MATWQLQDAKQQLSKVVDMARTDGPQTITRHGAEAAVVVSPAEYRRLVEDARPTLKDVLLGSPGDDGDLLLASIPPRGRWKRKLPKPLPD